MSNQPRVSPPVVKQQRREIPIIGAYPPDTEPPESEQEEPAQEEVAEETGDGSFPVFGEVLAMATDTERATETRTFTMKDKRYKFEIYVDGREDAELWSKLCAAMQYGYAQEMGSRLAGKKWEGVTERFPSGNSIKSITITDPAYLGNVKVLVQVLKRPAWGWSECLMMGHVLGRGFADVCEWAAEANGVTEKIFEQLATLEKNARSLSQSE